jgi:opacity protein-like surface antigen
MFNKIALAASFALLSSTAFAAAPGQFTIGADAGTTRFKSDGESGHRASQGLFTGYQINDTFGVEVGFRRLNRQQEDFVDAKVNQTSVSATAAFPIANNLKAYGRLGMNRIEVRGSVTFLGVREEFKEHDTKIVSGFGLSYTFTPKLSARIELQRPMRDLLNLSAGIGYSF